MKKSQKKMLIRIISASILTLACLLTDKYIPVWYLRFAAYMVPYLIAGYDVLKKAFHGIRHGQVFDENFLMTVATLGAIAVGISNALRGTDDDYLEATVSLEKPS